MRGHVSNTLLRLIPRRSPSTSATPSCSPQHTSSPFRISPSATSNASPNFAIHTAPRITLSRRALSSQLRTQTHFNVVRTALAVEASSLRYALLLSGEGEDALLRGWDAGVAVEDEDGT